MRRNAVPVFVLVMALLGLGLAYGLFHDDFARRDAGARRVVDQRSDVRLALSLDHAAGPIASERWEMRDDDGVSASEYRALGRDGVEITVTERARRTLDADANVAFFFDAAVEAGIWKIVNRPPRGDTATRYAIEIFQRTGAASGGRRVTFTDPHYWATTGGHQFRIHLSKGAPLPDLLRLSSTTLVDGRYEELVRDFEAFGSVGYRAKIAAARARLSAHA